MCEGISVPYVAGFFDGEGSIGIYPTSKNKACFYLRTQLTQNVTDVSSRLMVSLVKRWGGNLSQQGTLSGNTKYNWQLNGKLASAFLSEIRPWLLLKAEQADLALDWYIVRVPGTRDALGRIASYVGTEFDADIATRLKALKKG